jgi:hypothetical protein
MLIRGKLQGNCKKRKLAYPKLALQRLPGEIIFMKQKSTLLPTCVISKDFVD